jgi:hypothetical protein
MGLDETVTPHPGQSGGPGTCASRSSTRLPRKCQDGHTSVDPGPHRPHADGPPPAGRRPRGRAGPGPVRVPQPRRQRQGPHRPGHRRRRRTAGTIAAGDDPGRGNGGQHGGRPGSGGGRARLPAGLCHARQDVSRQARGAGRPGGRGDSRAQRSPVLSRQLPERRPPPGRRARLVPDGAV